MKWTPLLCAILMTDSWFTILWIV